MEDYLKFSEVFNEIFRLNKLDFYLNENIIEKFFCLYKNLIETNEIYNLTSITELNKVITLHFVDSLSVVDIIDFFSVQEKRTGGKSFSNKEIVYDEKQENRALKILDAGSGAGFPALPIAIAKPDCDVTSLDSTKKKSDFCYKVGKILNLNKLTVINNRIEDVARTPLRSSFDAVVARAVAKLNVLCELCLPFLKNNGIFIAMKGSCETAEKEIRQCENALKILGCKMIEIIKKPLITPEGEYERTLIVIEKKTPAPSIYPRSFIQISKNPL